MPIKNSQSPDFICKACGHRFKEKFSLKKIFEKKEFFSSLSQKCPNCPKCRSSNTVLLTY